ncbi:MAG: molybdate ABC transporter permease subunit [Rhodospirillales bacterium]|nr:molybdate ABC transporter permease subunit [Rhodospirillales bacterium]
MFALTPFEIGAIQLSLKVAGLALLGCLPMGLLAAWVLARCDFYGKSLLNGVIHLPLVLPPVVVGYLLLVLFGKQGALGRWLWETFEVSIAFSWKGAAVAAGIMAFPLMVRSIRLSLELVDTGLEDAARTLGASPKWVFITVTLPLILPGLLTGTILAFARSLGEFGATITFVSNIPGETQTLPLALYSLTQAPNGDVGALRLVVISVVIGLAALIASEALSRRINNRLR